MVQADDPRGLALDWKNPQVEWLSDERPAVVTRAIECLAAEENIESLCFVARTGFSHLDVAQNSWSVCT